MDPRYADFCRMWPDRVRRQRGFDIGDPPDLVVRGTCDEATAEMVQQFPELIRVRGHYGHVEHWWCKTATGEIIDPTFAQFRVLAGQSDWTYVEHREGIDPEPIGKCMNCGGYVWRNVGYGSYACSEECGRELQAEYG